MKTNKNTKKEKAVSNDIEFEKLELLRRANEKTGKQLSISSETGNLEEIDELRAIIGKEFENPEEKYNIYYKGIRKLLMDNLPKGKSFKEMRDIIYDEKNIFLTLGKRKSDNKGIRRGDSRMTYQPVMNEILDIIIKWVAESRNAFQLYKEFYELNNRHGYGHEEYDETLSSVSKAMMKLSEGE